jgi:hypothetical protein
MTRKWVETPQEKNRVWFKLIICTNTRFSIRDFWILDYWSAVCLTSFFNDTLKMATSTKGSLKPFHCSKLSSWKFYVPLTVFKSVLHIEKERKVLSLKFTAAKDQLLTTDRLFVLHLTCSLPGILTLHTCFACSLWWSEVGTTGRGDWSVGTPQKPGQAEWATKKWHLSPSIVPETGLRSPYFLPVTRGVSKVAGAAAGTNYKTVTSHCAELAGSIFARFFYRVYCVDSIVGHPSCWVAVSFIFVVKPLFFYMCSINLCGW